MEENFAAYDFFHTITLPFKYDEKHHEIFHFSLHVRYILVSVDNQTQMFKMETKSEFMYKTESAVCCFRPHLDPRIK